ncbi:hypothetical protein KIPB_006752 [Kipferlia bialata]|uniref:Uncharacterized protein n=1 Tax=Kipferlia bialata TaxID=797122 RepID=A0A9K3CXQ7_9EUKA|nr:hypothetical protein KIPB_006752 [Kipferlia bialata]|eukprot:g6752.t1
MADSHADLTPSVTSGDPAHADIDIDIDTGTGTGVDDLLVNDVGYVSLGPEGSGLDHPVQPVLQAMDGLGYGVGGDLLDTPDTDTYMDDLNEPTLNETARRSTRAHPGSWLDDLSRLSVDRGLGHILDIALILSQEEPQSRVDQVMYLLSQSDTDPSESGRVGIRRQSVNQSLDQPLGQDVPWGGSVQGVLKGLCLCCKCPHLVPHLTHCISHTHAHTHTPTHTMPHSVHLDSLIQMCFCWNPQKGMSNHMSPRLGLDRLDRGRDREGGIQSPRAQPHPSSRSHSLSPRDGAHGMYGRHHRHDLDQVVGHTDPQGSVYPGQIHGGSHTQTHRHTHDPLSPPSQGYSGTGAGPSLSLGPGPVDVLRRLNVLRQLLALDVVVCDVIQSVQAGVAASDGACPPVPPSPACAALCLHALRSVDLLIAGVEAAAGLFGKIQLLPSTLMMSQGHDRDIDPNADADADGEQGVSGCLSPCALLFYALLAGDAGGDPQRVGSLIRHAMALASRDYPSSGMGVYAEEAQGDAAAESATDAGETGVADAGGRASEGFDGSGVERESLSEGDMESLGSSEDADLVPSTDVAQLFQLVGRYTYTLSTVSAQGHMAMGRPRGHVLRDLGHTLLSLLAEIQETPGWVGVTRGLASSVLCLGLGLLRDAGYPLEAYDTGVALLSAEPYRLGMPCVYTCLRDLEMLLFNRPTYSARFGEW